MMACLFHRPLQPGEIAGAVNDPHYLHAIFDQSIERQPTLDDQDAGALGNLGTSGAELGMIA